MLKITFMGAGSTVFVRNVLGDCMCTPVLCESTIALYDIDEEAATGTSNGALTYYLYRKNIVKPGVENTFIQGEAMDRPSKINSKLTEEGGVKVQVGGNGVLLAKGDINI